MTQKKSNRIVLMASMLALVSLMIIGPAMGEEEGIIFDPAGGFYSRTTKECPPYAGNTYYTNTEVSWEGWSRSPIDYGVLNIRYGTCSPGNVAAQGGYAVLQSEAATGSFIMTGSPSVNYYWAWGTKAASAEYDQGWYVLNEEAPPELEFSYAPEQPWIAPVNVTFSYAGDVVYDSITWELQSLSGPYLYGYAQATEDPTFKITYAGTYQLNLSVTNESTTYEKSEVYTVYNPTDLEFGIQIIDDDIPFGGTTEAELVGGQTENITAIRWYAYYPGQTAPQDFYESGSDSYRLNYALKDGNWMGWDDSTESFSNNAGATLPNPVTLKPEYSGEVIVGCYVFLDDDTWQNPVSSITVGEGQGLQTIRFTAQDALTNSVISPVQYNIQKLSDGSWTNQTEPGSGQITVNYPAGTSLSIEVIPPSGSDYSIITEIYQVENTAGVLQNHVIKMWKNASEDPGFTTANLILKRGDNLQPIQGATIVLPDAQECTTPATGSCQFTVTNDTQISATITKTGFFTETIYFTPFGSSYLKELKIWPIVVSTTPISTIPTTSGPGGAPTPTTTSGPGETPEPGVTYPPGVPMPGTTITYPPGVPVIGAVGSETGNVSAREAAEKSLTDWMLYGSAFVGFIFLVMLVGFSGDALKKWSWIWK